MSGELFKKVPEIELLLFYRINRQKPETVLSHPFPHSFLLERIAS